MKVENNMMTETRYSLRRFRNWDYKGDDV